MRRLIQLLAIMLLCTGVAAAQNKSRSLTMDDVAPAAPKTSDSNSNNNSNPETNGPAPNSEQERAWQDKLNDAELKVLTAELNQAYDETSSDKILDLKKKQDRVKELTAEGAKQGFQARKSNDVIFRERFVKLRKEMIQEIKLNPNAKSTETRVVMVEAKKSRAKKPKGMRGQRTPFTEQKVVQGKRTKLEELEDQVEDLEEEGRRAGVSASVFAD